MDISEMHVWFRQYAQQMGMQNVRAILPEQIDILINTSILDKVNTIVKQHAFYSDNKSVDSSFKLGQLNALKPLYRGCDVDVTELLEDNKVSFNVDDFVENYLYIASLALNYKDTQKEVTTGYVSVNVIDDVSLYDTLNDYILRSTIKNPIGSIIDNCINIYVQDCKNFKPKTVRISYIKEPIKVNYKNNISSDLPSYLHVDILKHAADLYNISVRGGTYNTNRELPTRSTDTTAASGEGYQS